MKQIITLMILCLAAGAVMAQPALKVASDSKVGIGIDAPTEKLEVANGNIKITGATGVAQQMRIDVTDPRAGFQLKNNSGDFAVFTLRGDFGDAVFSVFDQSMNRFNAAFNYNYVNRALNVQGTVASDGTILTSDKKLKSNVRPFTKGLSSVLKLEPISYQYTGDLGTTKGVEHVGVFAQNLQSVAPEFTVEQYFEEYSNEIDENNKSLERGSYLAIKDNEIKWMLVNAIKDQQAIIDNQESRITELETIIDGLANNSIINESLTQSGDASLAQNTPNPFVESTTIKYNLPSDVSNASIKFFSLNGSLLKTTKISTTGAGTVSLEASELPAGVYTYTLEADGKIIETKKMIKEN